MPRYCLECGTPLETRRIESRDLQACPACDYVRWPDPKLATVTVAEADGAVVFGRRAIEPGYGLWCLPGGFVNDDEHPALSAARECAEEIGAEVAIGDLLGIYHVARPGGPGMVVIAYHGRIVDPAQVTAGAEMLEVAMLRPEAAPPLAFQTHRAAMNEWLRTRETSVRDGR